MGFSLTYVNMRSYKPSDTKNKSEMAVGRANVPGKNRVLKWILRYYKRPRGKSFDRLVKDIK